jgi:LCP family protein required for cell wall assembly
MSNKPKRVKSQQKAKQKFPLKTILSIIWIVIIALVAVIFIYIYPKLKNMNIDSVVENPEPTLNPEEVLMETEDAPSDMATAVPIPEDTPEPDLEMKDNDDYGITNIMVFGMDNRYKRTILGGRSDVNIILTLDPENNEVRLTSIMRDTLIDIPSLGDYNRINAAIVYEDGPEGSINAIEKEFLVDIDHYVITSFRGMIEIIDSIGGVDVTLSQQEVWDTNGLIQEMNLLFGNRSEKYFIQTRGEHHLNGIQAVAYMRLRHTGGTTARDDRQKEVLLSARNQLSNMSLGDLDTALNTVTDWVKTDMEPVDFIKLTKDLYALRNGSYKASRVPYEGLYSNANYKGMAIIQYDREPNLLKMHDFIYNGKE